jgi:hypothetical protein
VSELSDKALSAIQDGVKAEVLVIDGRHFSTRQIFEVKREVLPAEDHLAVSTLTGLVDFVEMGTDTTGREAPKFVHIVNHCEVGLFSGDFGPTKQRTNFITAAFQSLLGQSFKFGEFYNQEEFVVGLQSLFEPTPSRATVLKVIGTIQENIVKEFADDGVTQSVAAKAGQVLVREIEVPNPVFLKPFRTFREIEQPESPFVLRVRTGKEKPQCALFEADGGRWKLTAIQAIKEYLEDKIDLPIIA